MTTRQTLLKMIVIALMVAATAQTVAHACESTSERDPGDIMGSPPGT